MCSSLTLKLNLLSSVTNLGDQGVKEHLKKNQTKNKHNIHDTKQHKTTKPKRWKKMALKTATYSKTSLTKQSCTKAPAKAKAAGFLNKFLEGRNLKEPQINGMLGMAYQFDHLEHHFTTWPFPCCDKASVIWCMRYCWSMSMEIGLDPDQESTLRNACCQPQCVVDHPGSTGNHATNSYKFLLIDYSRI